MRTNDETKFSFLLIGLGVVTSGGLMAALLARKETRDLLAERSRKAIDYLNQQLRETTEGVVEKGKQLMSHRCCSGDATTEAHQEERRETLGE